MFYRPECGEMGWPEDEPEMKPIYWACAPWQLMAHKQAKLESPSIVVDNKDPENVMLLNPITDDESRVVGVAGMIVDMDHFREVLLPEVVKKALPGFALEFEEKNMVVQVFDPQKRVVFATGKVDDG